ncbi:MAG: hypothetical protein ABIG60_00565 [Patescibacteria group bacterium]
MGKIKEKYFGYFWLFGGLIWIGAGIRHLVVRGDLVGGLIEFVAAFCSLILAYKYLTSSKK